ncbi:hypothetical protein [Natronobacterium gregoryi]|uniref:Uncharacterized protein n=2 Tax=Natronobacterium gregoryi TaxID=44930 RepID=L0AID0_NATGS|nr:hypothetical protein [Natronobacterium gregoryi]AFZ73194.1 hypothetical protein Natgr_2011 [Natronobacterium gregoryi SP2]ELY71348.1 hypothetical protein C490_05437 [Natronobacterium gregoryi SP2]PLK21604.1 hypothetical protein CYV19_03310 [Natronobacterium gregoryi SP2]SFI58805.1 hypothetical protein SAMN05443661_10270 [Natronobacterium gregoryi]
MNDDRDGNGRGRILLLTVIAVAVALPVAITQLEVSPHRVTVGTVVVTALLLVGTVALPALILTRWRADGGDGSDYGGRKRR